MGQLQSQAAQDRDEGGAWLKWTPMRSSLSIKELEELCRVIVISSQVDLDVSLRTLLPLSLPEPVKTRKSAEATLNDELNDAIKEPLMGKLLRAAHKSTDDVERTMLEIINSIAEIKTSEKESP